MKNERTRNFLMISNLVIMALFIFLIGLPACEREVVSPEQQLLQKAMVEKLSYVKYKDMIELNNGSVYMVARPLDKTKILGDDNGEKETWIIALKSDGTHSHDVWLTDLATLAPQVKEVYYRDQEGWAEAAGHYLW